MTMAVQTTIQMALAIPTMTAGRAIDAIFTI